MVEQHMLRKFRGSEAGSGRTKGQNAPFPRHNSAINTAISVECAETATMARGMRLSSRSWNSVHGYDSDRARQLEARQQGKTCRIQKQWLIPPAEEGKKSTTSKTALRRSKSYPQRHRRVVVTGTPSYLFEVWVAREFHHDSEIRKQARSLPDFVLSTTLHPNRHQTVENVELKLQCLTCDMSTREDLARNPSRSRDPSEAKSSDHNTDLRRNLCWSGDEQIEQ